MEKRSVDLVYCKELVFCYRSFERDCGWVYFCRDFRLPFFLSPEMWTAKVFNGV